MKQVALITGGSRGIGYGISQRLAQEGFDLAICGVRPERDVTESLNYLRDLGSEVIYCQTDISNREMRSEMLNTIQKHYRRLNVLVNNAGVAPKERKDILELSEENFEWLMRINLQGPFFLTQATAKWMIEQKKLFSDFCGCIINISSISATVASTNRGDYCMSKAGISMATKLWAVQLAEFSIPVYEVRPGIIKTDMTAPVETKYNKLLGEGLLLQSRWGMPEDVGKAVAMLVRNDLPYSTGQVIMVDGGLTVERL